MKKLAILALAASITACTQCPEICSIAGREHIPAHAETRYHSQCLSRDRHGVCTTKIDLPYTVWIEDQYYLQLIDFEAADHGVQVDFQTFKTASQFYKHTHLRRSCNPNTMESP